MSVSIFIKTSLMLLFMSMQVIAQQDQDITNRLSARENFKSKYGDGWNIRWNSKTETPSTIVGGKITKFKGSQIDNAKLFLEEERILLGIKSVQNELLLTKENTSAKGGTRYIFSQIVDGIPVIGSGYNVAVANDGSIYFVSGDYYPDVKVGTKPSLSSNAIIEIIKKDLNTIQNLKIDNPELFILPEDLSSEIKFRVVYVTTVRADKPLTAFKYTIDANNGEVISKDELIEKINECIETNMVEDRDIYSGFSMNVKGLLIAVLLDNMKDKSVVNLTVEYPEYKNVITNLSISEISEGLFDGLTSRASEL